LIFRRKIKYIHVIYSGRERIDFQPSQHADYVSLASERPFEEWQFIQPLKPMTDQRGYQLFDITPTLWAAS